MWIPQFNFHKANELPTVDTEMPIEDPQVPIDGNELEAQKVDIQPMKANFSEVGVSGLFHQGNYIYEEFLPQLRYPRAAKIYKEMASNDPTIGAILYMTEQLSKKANWNVKAGGNSLVDQQAKQFLEECMDDMEQSWNDTVSEILSMCTYGFSWHEIVYKKRNGDVRSPMEHSKYKDGRVAWRYLAERSQSTLHSWNWDDNQQLEAMVQQAAPDWRVIPIPYDKSLLFRTKIERENPEGRSLLRNAYRPWYFKKHIEEIEAIGIERDLTGYPVMIPPEGVDIWSPNNPDAMRLKQKAETIVRNIRRDSSEGLVLPFGWDLKLLSAGSTRKQFDTNQILNRYDQRIAITMLADIVMLGADKVGSFALAQVKKSLLAVALEAQLDNIAAEFNRRAIPKLFALNTFVGLTDYPKLVHGEVETPDLKELGEYLTRLSGAGMPLFPDIDLEGYLRQVASMPEDTAHTAQVAAKNTGAADPTADWSQRGKDLADPEQNPIGGKQQGNTGTENAVEETQAE